jgi:flagellar basal body rod protein FlgG
VRFTRNGQFHVNADGRLVTPSGLPVLGRSGPITLAGGNVTVAADGRITQQGNTVDELQLAGFPAGTRLQSIGGNLYRADAAPVPARETKVMQGYLEGSNVDSASEMVRLIELTRHIESIQRAMVTYDHAVGTGISELGKNR